MTSGSGRRTGARFSRAILFALGAFAVSLWAGVATAAPAAPAAPKPSNSAPAPSTLSASISGPGISGTETFNAAKDPAQYDQVVSMVSWMDNLPGNIISTTPPDLGPDYTIKLLSKGQQVALYDLYPLCPGGARSYRSDNGTGGTWFYAPRNLVDTLTALGVPVASATLPSGAVTPRIAATTASVSFGDVLGQSRTALLLAGGAAAFVLIVLGLAARRSRRIERRRTAPAAVSRLSAVTARRVPASGSGGPTARLRPSVAVGAGAGPRAAVPGQAGTPGRPTSLLHGDTGIGTPGPTAYGRPRGVETGWDGAGRASDGHAGTVYGHPASGSAPADGGPYGSPGAGASGVPWPPVAGQPGAGSPGDAWQDTSLGEQSGAGLPRAQRPVPPLPASPAESVAEAAGAPSWFTAGAGTAADSGPAPTEPVDPGEPAGPDYMPVRRVYPAPPDIVTHPATAVRGSAQVPGQFAGNAGVVPEAAEQAGTEAEGHRVVAMARVPSTRTGPDPLPPAGDPSAALDTPGTRADEPETLLDAVPAETGDEPETTPAGSRVILDVTPLGLGSPEPAAEDPETVLDGPETLRDMPPAGLGAPEPANDSRESAGDSPETDTVLRDLDAAALVDSQPETLTGAPPADPDPLADVDRPAPLDEPDAAGDLLTVVQLDPSGVPAGAPVATLDPIATLDPAATPLDAPLAALDALLAEPPLSAWGTPDAPLATLDVERVSVTPVPPPWETRAAGGDAGPGEPAVLDGSDAPTADATEADDAAGRTAEVLEEADHDVPAGIDAGFPVGGEDAGVEQAGEDGDGDGIGDEEPEPDDGEEPAEPDTDS